MIIELKLIIAILIGFLIGFVISFLIWIKTLNKLHKDFSKDLDALQNEKSKEN